MLTPAAAAACSAQVKLYFMIGLPGETDEDVMGIADTIEWLQRECRTGQSAVSTYVCS